jgi:hypothetical protein
MLLPVKLQVRVFVKAEPLSPISSSCSFAYASDSVKERGHKPGRIVEVPF